MNILFVNTNDIEGGAARAACRLYRGVQAAGDSARMLVLKKTSDDFNVLTPPGRLGALMPRIHHRVENAALRRYPRRQPGVTWSVNAFPYPMQQVIAAQRADIIHLHWIGAGFIPITTLARIGKPIVWTLHDEWAYTGGCHYTDGCTRFTSECGRCPQLRSDDENDLSRATWTRKSTNWRGLPLTIVAPSRWISEQAKQSSLFANHRIEIIPNGIDTSVFKPADRRLARTLLNLPTDKKLILFAGMSPSADRRKGLHLLQPALQRLADRWREDAELLILGASTPVTPPDFGIPCHFLGRLHDDVSLALVYAAANVFAAPSLQDNLPNTVMEAAACGTLSVAFRIGGLPDLIDHQQTGYLAQPFDVDDLAHGIEWALTQADEPSAAARRKVETTFDLLTVAVQYQSLYNDILTI